MSLSLATIISLRDKAVAAYEAALEAQQYTINTGQGSQTVTRARLESLSREIEKWNAEIEFSSRGNLVSVESVRYGSA